MNLRTTSRHVKVQCIKTLFLLTSFFICLLVCFFIAFNCKCAQHSKFYREFVRADKKIFIGINTAQWLNLSLSLLTIQLTLVSFTFFCVFLCTSMLVNMIV